jgi:NAD(P)H dehydrogenase (quinone)
MSSAITSATGHLGRLVLEKLKAKVPAASIIALARDPAHASDLSVTVREADHGKAETSSSELPRLSCSIG